MPQDSIVNIDSLAAVQDSLEKMEPILPPDPGPSSFFGNMLEETGMIAKYAPASDDWLLGVFLLALGLLAYLRVGYSRRLSQIIKASYDKSAAHELFREESTLRQRSSLMLLFIFLLSFSSLIFLFVRSFASSLIAPISFFTYVQIMVLVLLAYFIKIILVRFIGFIFKQQMLAREYSFNMIILLQVSGLLILPLVILLNYSYIAEMPLLVVALFVLAVAYTIRLLRGFGIGWNKSNVSRLHLFYYFCTLELIPAVLLTKSIMIVAGSN